MRTIRSLAALLVITLIPLACQREEKNEEKAINRLVEETQGSFPETMEQTKQLEQEVKRINVQIKQESEQRVNQINEELKKKKK